MNKPPAFQFYADDFLGGTVTMNHEERGIYILLLCVQWSKGHLTEDDFARLGRGLVEPSLNHVRTKFQPGPDGFWRNPRLEQERRKQAAFREQQSAKGKASAQQRFNHGSTAVQPSGVPKVNSPVSSLQSPSSNKDKDSRFAPPCAAELALEGSKVGLPESEQLKFLAYYESNGWKVGKNKMKDWRKAMIGWKLRWEETRGSKPGTNGQQSAAFENHVCNPQSPNFWRFARKDKPPTADEAAEWERLRGRAS